MATAAELRALADVVEEIEGAVADHLAAKGAFLSDRSDANQEWYRNAGNRLAALRDKARKSGITAADTSPGSVTIVPAGALQSQHNTVSEG